MGESRKDTSIHIQCRAGNHRVEGQLSRKSWSNFVLESLKAFLLVYTSGIGLGIEHAGTKEPFVEVIAF